MSTNNKPTIWQRTISASGWRVLAAIFFACFVIYEAGCEYTISGNPDVNLVEVRLSPQRVLMSNGGSLDFTAMFAGALNDKSVSWTVIGDTASHLRSSGLTATYTAPDSVPDGFAVTVFVRSNEDPSKAASCLVNVINTTYNAGEVALDPITSTILSSNSIQLHARVFGSTSPVKWSIVTGPGSISPTGLYVPLSTAADNTQVIVQATSTADTTQSAQSYITLVRSTDSLKCFTRDVLPILTANCGMSGCHGDGGNGGTRLTTYEGVVREVTPGDARSSRLYKAITELNQINRMPPPPHPTLSPNQVLTIGQWINEGAQNTVCQ